jgi:hypothetical protein
MRLRGCLVGLVGGERKGQALVKGRRYDSASITVLRWFQWLTYRTLARVLTETAGSSCCFHVSRPARIALTTHCLSTTAGACAPLTLYLQAFALRQCRSRRACCPDPSRRPASGVGRPTSSGREEGSKAKEGGRTKLRRRVERAPFGGWDGAKGELKVDRGGRWQLGRCRS